MFNPTGRVVLITGCSTCIGRATALYLAQHGWLVFASARRIDDIRELESGHLSILPLDATDETARAQVMAEVVKQAGRLDGLVNNAGLNIGGPLELVSLDDARAVQDKCLGRAAAGSARRADHARTGWRPHRQHQLGHGASATPVLGSL